MAQLYLLTIDEAADWEYLQNDGPIYYGHTKNKNSYVVRINGDKIQLFDRKTKKISIGELTNRSYGSRTQTYNMDYFSSLELFGGVGGSTVHIDGDMVTIVNHGSGLPVIGQIRGRMKRLDTSSLCI